MRRRNETKRQAGTTALSRICSCYLFKGKRCLVTLLCNMAAKVDVGDEDTVCYRLFVSVPCEKDVCEYLEEQRDVLLAFLSRFCVNYIWHQEPFSLRLHSVTGNSVKRNFPEKLLINLRNTKNGAHSPVVKSLCSTSDSTLTF